MLIDLMDWRKCVQLDLFNPLSVTKKLNDLKQTSICRSVLYFELWWSLIFESFLADFIDCKSFRYFRCWYLHLCHCMSMSLRPATHTSYDVNRSFNWPKLCSVAKRPVMCTHFSSFAAWRNFKQLATDATVQSSAEIIWWTPEDLNPSKFVKTFSLFK